MSAVLKEQQPQQPRNRRSQTDETRLAVLETRWEDVIPNLATKEDIAVVKGAIEGFTSGQGSHLAMLQDMKLAQDGVDNRLESIDKINGKNSYELGAVKTDLTKVQEGLSDVQGAVQTLQSNLSAFQVSTQAGFDLAKKDIEAVHARIEAQGNKTAFHVIAGIGSILILLEVISRIWPK